MPLTEEQIEYQQALALLSPEERAAMAEDEDDVAIINKLAGQEDAEVVEKTATKVDSGDGDDNEDEVEKGGEVGATAAQATADAAVLAADEAAATAKAEAAAADVKAEVIQLDLAPVNEQYESKLQALDASKAAQFKLLMDGEITAENYAKIESQYMRDRDAARDDKGEAESWFREVHAFKTRALKDDGINYHADPEKAQAWDDWVKRLATNPANANKDGAWFLEQAHAKVKIEFSDSIVAKTTTAADVVKNVAKNKGRAPNLADLPPTLSGIPAASETDVGDSGEFAHLDKLSGMDYERALARLSPEAKDRYEQG